MVSGVSVPDTLELHRRGVSLERRRYVGLLLMYSSVFFLLMLLGVMATAMMQHVLAGGGRRLPPLRLQPVWIQWPAYAAVGGLMVSLPMTAVGAVVRLVSGIGLSRLFRGIEEGSLPPWPPIGPGERLGWWVVTGWSSEAIVLSRRPLPALVWWLTRWALVTLLVAMGVATLMGSWRRGGPMAPAAAFAAIMGLLACATVGMLAATTLEIDLLRREVRLRRRHLSFVPSSVVRIGFEEIELLSAAWSRVEVMTKGGPGGRGRRVVSILPMAPGTLGRWQAKRLAALVYACVVSSGGFGPDGAGSAVGEQVEGDGDEAAPKV